MNNPTRPPHTSVKYGRIAGMALPAIPAGFDDLSPEDKIEYIQGLWERVVSHPEEVPAEDWQRELVAERLNAFRAGKTTTRPWREAGNDLRASLKTTPRR